MRVRHIGVVGLQFDREENRLVMEIGLVSQPVDDDREKMLADMLAEIFPYVTALLIIECGFIDDDDILACQFLPEISIDVFKFPIEFLDATLDGGKCLLGLKQVVFFPARAMQCDDAVQRGHAHAEKLVEVVRENPKKDEPFQQWHTCIHRFRKHPFVEIQPTDFTIDENRTAFFHKFFGLRANSN